MTTLLRHLAILGLLAPLLSAQPAEASAAETAWFAGEWIVTPAPVEGFDDLGATDLGSVRIEHVGGARLARHSPERRGRPATTTVFTVRKLGANFPWWPDQGPARVARKVSDEAFDLAPIGPTGRADWARALRHTRLPAATAAPSP